MSASNWIHDAVRQDKGHSNSKCIEISQILSISVGLEIERTFENGEVAGMIRFAKIPQSNHDNIEEKDNHNTIVPALLGIEPNIIKLPND